MERPKNKRPTKLRLLIASIVSGLVMAPFLLRYAGKIYGGEYSFALNALPVLLTGAIVFVIICFADRSQRRYRSSFPTEGTPGHPLYTTFYQDED